MKEPRLLPSLVDDCVNDLVDGVARHHAGTRQPQDVTIIVPGVVVDGMPAGDYEVVIRRKVSTLGERLKSLENPWMQIFEK